MPRGRWIILIAVVGLALGGNVQPINHSGSSQGTAAERKENESPKASRVAAGDQQVSAPNVAREDERYAAEERQRGRDDLVAQQDTAFWTRVMGMVAVLAVFLSTIGIWLIYITFRETRRAADSAQNTYRALTDLERARVIAHTSRVLWNPPYIMAVSINLTNIGRSTAMISTAHCGYLKGCDYPVEFEQTKRIDQALSTASDTTFSIRASDPETFKTHPFIGGYVQYRSTFGQHHRAHFLSRIDWEPEREEPTFREAGYTVSSEAPDREEREANFGWPADS